MPTLAATVGIPVIRKGAVEVVVSTQALAAAVQGVEIKEVRVQKDEEDAYTQRERIGKQKGKAPRSNHAQNQQFDAVEKELNLTKEQSRKLHEAISGKGYNYKELLEIVEDTFGN